MLPLRKRINIHRKSKFGCNHMIVHFRNESGGSSISIKILEILPGIGYRNNKVCLVEYAKRLKRRRR